MYISFASLNSWKKHCLSRLTLAY